MCLIKNLNMFLLLVVLVSALSIAESLREGMKKEEMERVVGGYDAKDGEYPYTVALYNDGKFICTGSIISETSILTAAHCVVSDGVTQEPRVFFAIAGVANRSSIDGVMIEFRDIKVHPEYDEQNNDLAILETSAPIQFSQKIKSICITNEKIGSLVFRRVVAVGWGQKNRDMENPDLPDTLQYVYQRVVSNFKCYILYYLNNVPDSVVCATGILSGICGGDSGGPLVYNSQSQPILVGTASYVNGVTGCGRLLGPAAYSRISSFTQYIKETATGDVCVA